MNKFFISFSYRKPFGILGTGAISGKYDGKKLSEMELYEIRNFIIMATGEKFKKLVVLYWKEW